MLTLSDVPFLSLEQLNHRHVLSQFVAAWPYKSDAIFEMDSTLTHGKHVLCVKADNFDFSIRTQQRVLKDIT